MSELIDRQALKDYVSSLSTHPLNEWDTWGVLAAIDKQPTITAQRWRRAEEPPKENGRYLVYMFTSDWRWEFKFASYLHDRWIGTGGGDVRYWMPIEPPQEDA